MGSRDDLLRNGTPSDIRVENAKRTRRQLFFDEAVQVAARSMLLAPENAVNLGSRRRSSTVPRGHGPRVPRHRLRLPLLQPEAFIHCASAGTRCEAAIRRGRDGDELRRLREAPPVTAGYARLFPWHDTVADEAVRVNPRRSRPRRGKSGPTADYGSCPRPTPDDAATSVRTLADRPE